MEKKAANEHVTDLSLVGLEKVFVQVEQKVNDEQIAKKTNIHEQTEEVEAESFELVSMAEASRRMGMPYPTLRRQVLSGKIPSAPGPDGKPMVKLMNNECSEKTDEHSGQSSEQKWFQSEYSVTIQRLLEQVESERNYSKTLNARLEAANHRNGYLEAQVDQQHEQIKLLTDRKPKTSFWKRFFGIAE